MASLVQFGQRHVAKGVNRLVNAVIKTGRGSYVYLEDGRKMLDFTCGIGVTNLGLKRTLMVFNYLPYSVI